jgi:hypothetical protein
VFSGVSGLRLARRVLLLRHVRKNGSFIAWLGTGLLVATVPFVARAQLEEAGVLPDPFDSGAPSSGFDSGTGSSPFNDTGVEDAGNGPDALPGPTLPNGDAAPPPDLVMDTPPGCTCSVLASSASGMGAILAPAPFILIAALALRRRPRK